MNERTKENTATGQPAGIIMMLPTKPRYVEVDTKGRPIRVEKSIAPIDMKLRARIFQQLRLKQYYTANYVGLHDKEGNVSVTVDMSKVSDCNHYGEVEASARKLITTIFNYPDKEYAIRMFPIVTDARRRRGSRYIQVFLSPGFVNNATGLWKWAPCYDADTVCSLKSVASMKLYELIARKNPTPFRIEYKQLKNILQQRPKMKDDTPPSEFERSVLNKAKKKLDAKAPYSFAYERIRENEEWIYYIRPVQLKQNDSFTKQSNKTHCK